MNVIALVVFAQVGVLPPSAVIRVNQLGYLPDGLKIAVFCSLEKAALRDFELITAAGKRVLQRLANSPQPVGPCAAHYRLPFSSAAGVGGDLNFCWGGMFPPVPLFH